eukprot:7408454-Lingulodinium_polyedra.AAC.1
MAGATAAGVAIASGQDGDGSVLSGGPWRVWWHGGRTGAKSWLFPPRGRSVCVRCGRPRPGRR